MELGIDISHWQNDKSTAQKMDFAKAVEQGAKYVFIKISERGEIDEDFEYNWQAAKDAGAAAWRLSFPAAGTCPG